MHARLAQLCSFRPHPLTQHAMLPAQDWEEGDGDYLAPELLHDAKPTPAADIYSLGATLFETATGVLAPHDRVLPACRRCMHAAGACPPMPPEVV